MKPTNALYTPGFVYILTNKNKTTLYVGVTSDLERRTWQHKTHFFRNSFTDRYNLEYLVYWEAHDAITSAIAREKEIKGWRREKKEALIATKNPDWQDLSNAFLSF